MNKTILITGNRKGIGRFLTEKYLLEGYHVVGCSRNNSDLNHKNYEHFICNVGNEEEVIELFKSLKKSKLIPDIVINNAGFASMNHFVLTPSKTSKSLFDVNFFGTLNVSRYASKSLIKKKWGRIINFSSVAVPLNLEGELSYASAKASIETATRIMAKELSSFNITVNAVAPNPIATDLTKTLPKNKLDELFDQQTIKKYGTLDDVKNVIDFFISEKSDFITAQTIYLGGIC